MLGCTHASTKVNAPVQYADGLDEYGMTIVLMEHTLCVGYWLSTQT